MEKRPAGAVMMTARLLVLVCALAGAAGGGAADETQSAKFMPTEERRVRHILVQTEAKAKAIIDELESGVDFAELASTRSTDSGSAALGGDLGYFTRGQMVPLFEEAAFAIAVGEFGHTPVETQFGWHVIKVVDARRQARPSLEVLEQGPRQSMRDASHQVELEKLGPRVQP
jgi:peptidyl-prolyl cis-trans isomerase C